MSAIDNGRGNYLPLDFYPVMVTSSRSNYLSEKAYSTKGEETLVPLWYDLIKQLSDPIIAFFALLFLLPLILLVALLVKISSAGPVFYMQERVGRGGIPFRIVKFRSMYQNAEVDTPMLSSAFDRRITKWGRVMRRMRLDELPQFYNVLKGEMSLIGPRPERQYYIDQIFPLAPQYQQLLRIKPGITSLGQVKFGYAENVQEMIERSKFDVQYLHKVSPGMDLNILIRTVLTILQGKGQ
jgi:lipopolysaccharide/colanic/teichoic acid biosynthesis glycosyltransferase